MRSGLALALLVACGGPTHDQLVETHAARSHAAPVEAPPASTSDEDRSHLTQSFDDMEATQKAYQETKPAPPPPPPPAAGDPPKKKGVAEQGYLPKKKK
jgi:hypothetical protein